MNRNRSSRLGFPKGICSPFAKGGVCDAPPAEWEPRKIEDFEGFTQTIHRVLQPESRVHRRYCLLRPEVGEKRNNNPAGDKGLALNWGYYSRTGHRTGNLLPVISKPDTGGGVVSGETFYLLRSFTAVP